MRRKETGCEDELCKLKDATMRLDGELLRCGKTFTEKVMNFEFSTF